jgi:hypothetical protein
MGPRIHRDCAQSELALVLTQNESFTRSRSRSTNRRPS